MSLAGYTICGRILLSRDMVNDLALEDTKIL